MEPLRIGILGAARIAASFVKGVAPSTEVSVRCVASRDPERGQAFAEAHGVPKAVDSYEELLASPRIDAVYIPLTNDQHLRWSLKALAAGKHVLCEKPLALRAKDVGELYAAARTHGRVLMEAFPYRFQPQTLDLLHRVRSGSLGLLRHVSGEFGFPLSRPDDYRLDAGKGGGALWDVGVYPLSMIRALAGSLPEQVQALAHERGGVDHGLAATLRWANGMTATLACRFDCFGYRAIRILGERAALASGFHNHVDESQAWVEIHDQPGYASRREAVAPGNGFQLEAEAFAALVRGEPAHPLWPTEAETRETTRLVEALLRSVQEGRAVRP
jgi:predicted dehydrogenase